MYIFYFYLIKLWSILIELEIFKLEILFFDLEGFGLVYMVIYGLVNMEFL